MAKLQSCLRRIRSEIDAERKRCHDNRQRAANETLRLQNLWDGIEVFAALIAKPGGELR